jgi:hypothetical protein
VFTGLIASVRAAEPSVAEITFDQGWAASGGISITERGLPPWILGVRQEGGTFRDDPGYWEVEAMQPLGAGRVTILLDRQQMQEDLAAVILYEGWPGTDLVVQLFDSSDQVVVSDLFGNLMTVGTEAQTDTFIVPLRKYPVADRIVIRRIHGMVRIYGVALYPVVSEAEADVETLRHLVRLLGDPPSREHPLVRALERMARRRHVVVRSREVLSGLIAQAGTNSISWMADGDRWASNSVILDSQWVHGYYNDSLGTILDGTQPSIALPGGPGPNICPAPEPDLTAAAKLLGNWLSAKPHPLSGAWRGPGPIPKTWALDTEVAIVYRVRVGPEGLTDVRGDFDADNGIFVWVNGQFKFGCVQPGYPSPGDHFEYRGVQLGDLPAGENYIQVLLVDSGTATGFKLRIRGTSLRALGQR